MEISITFKDTLLNSAQNIDCTPNTSNSNTCYFILPYIGNFSNRTNITVKQISHGRFCKDLDMKAFFFFFRRLKLKIFSVLKNLSQLVLNPSLLFTNLLVQDVIPVILVRLLAIFQRGLKSTL